MTETTATCYACGKEFEPDEPKKTPHDEMECHDCFFDRWEWCNVCKEYQLIDWNEPCRHLFWSDEICGWMGCGVYERNWPGHKESLFAVLDKIGNDAASAIVHALRKHDFNLQFHGTIFGPTGIWLYLDQDYGYRFTENLTPDEEERMSLGVGWLNSLEPGGATTKADEQTVAWIQEWQAARSRHEVIQYFHSELAAGGVL